MLPQWIIEKKRDGLSLSEPEIRFFVDGYARGEIPDYQAAAFAMAVFFKGMDFDEVSVMTDAMMRSGDTVDTSSLGMPTADKHSTGGIGDKVSLLLAPLVACCGVGVPMLSGRGLGITGGTLDKLESITGYDTQLPINMFLDIVGVCGCSIMGQTATLAPADKKLYALRDVTGTVPSIPLISASIMSKKLAEGAGSLVLDVKWGSGAFMKDIEGARELAKTMVEIGKRMGRNMAAVLTDMNQPLGRSAGNAVEVVETISALNGNGSKDLMAVTMKLGAEMLVLSGKSKNEQDAMKCLQEALDSGAAFDKLKEMVGLHGGSIDVLDEPARLPHARYIYPFEASRGGTVARVDAEKIGRACIVLGAGRKAVTDNVDHAVGINGIVKIGEKVEPGEPLCVVHANDENVRSEAEALIEKAFEIGDSPVNVPDLIVERIG